MNSLENIIQNPNLQFVDEVPKDLKCTKCTKIMIDAHAIPCGCCYCMHCLEDIINENERPLCIENGEDCKNHILQINKNVLQSFVTIKKIENIQVKCLNKNCCKIIRLKDFKKHLDICQFGQFNCPFEKLGCVEIKNNENSLSEHMEVKSVEHIKMLLDYLEKTINDLKSDIERKLNEEKNVTNTKFVDINVQLTDNNITLQLLNNTLSTLTGNDISKLQNDAECYKIEINELKVKLEIEIKKNEELNEIVKKLSQKNNCMISKLENDKRRNNENHDNLKEQLYKLKLQLDSEKNKKKEVEDNNKNDIDKIKRELNKMKLEMDSEKKRHKNVEEKLNNDLERVTEELNNIKLDLNSEKKKIQDIEKSEFGWEVRHVRDTIQEWMNDGIFGTEIKNDK